MLSWLFSGTSEQSSVISEPVLEHRSELQSPLPANTPTSCVTSPKELATPVQVSVEPQNMPSPIIPLPPPASPVIPTLSELAAVVQRSLTPIQEEYSPDGDQLVNPDKVSFSVKIDTVPSIHKQSISPIKTLLDKCNEKWLFPYAWRLERDSSICYRLKNSADNEVFLIYIKPIDQLSEITYEFGIREIYYPHIQSLDKFNQRMQSHKIAVSVFNKRLIQIGKENLSLYLTVKGTQINEYSTLADALESN